MLVWKLSHDREKGEEVTSERKGKCVWLLPRIKLVRRSRSYEIISSVL